MEELDWGILPPQAGLLLAVPPWSLALQPHATCLSPLPLGIAWWSRVRSASQQSFSNLFVIFAPALFMKAACRNALPLITTPFLSVLFPAGCFALTHQIKTWNRRWGTSGPGYRASTRREAPRDKIRFFSLFAGPCCGMFRSSCRSPRGGQQPPARAPLSLTQLQSANV